MTFEDARHLLSRAGLGGTPVEIDALTLRSRRDAVEQLAAAGRAEPATPAPAGLEWQARSRASRTPEERQRMRKARRQQGRALKAWWFGELVHTDAPSSSA